ncbi:SDR family oxidoreductase [Paenibacillus sp. OV219]|uniref:SDR family oxidoreductase n=1 Tax=Paenibacillus sp. OV219 TaxID=1884377 RepID=UPI0008AB62FD|nr:SDR family oxidoreductase [Paenibacillus sp. OV219]SEN52278.1 NAD(P)H dehydrogenase (quinone) [Paenibacillus sp. OV219]
MKLLVTGATGKLGAEVVEELLKTVPASQIAVSVRNPEKAEGLRAQGIDVRHGDFDQPETLDAAFQGIDRILIISTDGDTETRIRQHVNAIEAAARAKVGFIAYTSLAGATDSKILFAPPHQAAEQALRESGVPYALLRNNWYLENEVGSIQGVMAGAPWVTAAGSGKVGWALHHEYAQAAAAVLAGVGHENKTYELSGTLLTQEELVAALGAVLGKEVAVQQVDDETYAGIMKSVGVPDFAIPIVVGIQQGIREGSLAVESNDFEKLLGRPLTPIQDALKQVVSKLS